VHRLRTAALAHRKYDIVVLAHSLTKHKIKQLSSKTILQ